MSDSFNKMNQEKPPYSPPSLSQNMSRAERNLKNAGDRLTAQQVQRGIDSENKALKAIQETQSLLNEIKNYGLSNVQARQPENTDPTGNRKSKRFQARW